MRLDKEPWVVLEEARALSGNPHATSARYHLESKRVLADDYQVHATELGQGMSGAVNLATGRLDEQKYAVKRFRKADLTVEQRRFLQREVEIHLACDHPNIVKLCDVYETSKELALVMECCAGGELFDKVAKYGRMNDLDAAVATRQMLRALCYLHVHEIVHRDIKLENFLYESESAEASLKLIDFGFARIWCPGMLKMHTSCGSVAYISPEVLHGKGYTNKCDLWSMGVIVFILLSGYMPFQGSDDAMIGKIKLGRVNWKGKAWNRVPAEAVGLVRALLAIDPGSRPDAKMALGHPWLARLADHEEPRLSKQVVLSIHEYAGASRLRRAVLQLLARDLLPQEAGELRQLFLGLDHRDNGTISARDFEDALCEFRREQADAGLGSCAPTCLTRKDPVRQSPSNAPTMDTDGSELSSVSSSRSLTREDSDLTDCGVSRAGYRLQWGQKEESQSSVTPAGADLTEADAAPVGARLQWGQIRLGADLEEAGELFRVLDANGDGKVCFSDFVAAALGSQPWLREKAVLRAFARLDVDRSGSVGAEDLCRALGGPFESTESDALLASAGMLLNAQGEATPNAFATLLHA